MEFAVIATGGKQYRVKKGQILRVEKLGVEEGETVTFDKVLLVEGEKDVKIGTPEVKGATVSGKVTKVGKGKKVIVIKYKAKSRYFKKNGHRQPFTEVSITDIKS
jgi:large subunit ribosomal protein L21